MEKILVRIDWVWPTEVWLNLLTTSFGVQIPNEATIVAQVFPFHARDKLIRSFSPCGYKFVWWL